MAALTEQQRSDILTDSWIGPRYRRVKFSSLGTKRGTELFELGIENTNDFRYNGRSLYLYGKGGKDAAMLFGACLAFRAVNVKAIHLSKLSDALDTFDSEITTTLLDCDMAIVHGFFDASSKQNPIADRTKFRIEWFLNERFSMEKSVVLVGSSEPNVVGAWWPEAVTDLITTHYETRLFPVAAKGEFTV